MDNTDRNLAPSAWESVPRTNVIPIVESVRTPAPIHTVPYGTAHLGAAIFQALRVRLRSHCPSGTFRKQALAKLDSLLGIVLVLGSRSPSPIISPAEIGFNSIPELDTGHYY
jgi:hypothetical protein